MSACETFVQPLQGDFPVRGGLPFYGDLRMFDYYLEECKKPLAKPFRRLIKKNLGVGDRLWNREHSEFIQVQWDEETRLQDIRIDTSEVFDCMRLIGVPEKWNENNFWFVELMMIDDNEEVIGYSRRQPTKEERKHCVTVLWDYWSGRHFFKFVPGFIEAVTGRYEICGYLVPTDIKVTAEADKLIANKRYWQFTRRNLESYCNGEQMMWVRYSWGIDEDDEEVIENLTGDEEGYQLISLWDSRRLVKSCNHDFYQDFFYLDEDFDEDGNLKPNLS
jgi:hypothetical protein